MSVTERSLPAIVTNLLSGAKPPPGVGRAAEAYLAALTWRKHLARIGFCLLVVAPTLLATVFYGLLAAPRYVSEVKFIVRSVSSQRATGLDMLFRTFGISKTVDDANVIQQYLQSRDALQGVIDAGVDVKAIFQRPEADWWSSYPYFWRRDTTESLFDYFSNRVSVVEDSTKGILELKVVTFRPEDSLLLSKTLLKLAEGMVNRMNERAQRDAMGSAQREVNFAMETVIKAQGELTAFRNKEIIVDPSKSTFSLIETIGNLSTDLSFAQAELKQMLTTSPNSPQIPTQRAKIAALEERVRVERAKMAGGDNSLANKIATYEQLALRRDLADKSLSNAMNALDVARQEARRQHIYVEEVVEPNLPDESTEPRRFRSVMAVLVFGFAIFAVIWIVSVGYGEHTQ
ncbi:WcbD protein [Azorhizobium caulinodans ORS 571]|uniref:WcbD protein n=1 Tax=Azorhizobium caulinodans (strain ATCC 43989 / DSM 5975 / JCM 20966 / LMG 6465 / NBRC 14845 / NCIMB 13405 / ORS 571) TaxID=438753 RepID=A8IG49_AZOC5|nr:WcbD protein [Azorhizobium]TDT91470.1 capsular polysaccharide transport system permease protein [Azorhizobium sp. AG788]BAF86037.1 WcbD protein [Azorhizobium caulinodans ORS 571]